MERNRGAPRLQDLARGPGRLCEALRIDRRLDGIDLCQAGPLWLGSDGRAPDEIGLSEQIGITRRPTVRCASTSGAVASSAARGRSIDEEPARRDPRCSLLRRTRLLGCRGAHFVFDQNDQKACAAWRSAPRTLIVTGLATPLSRSRAAAPPGRTTFPVWDRSAQSVKLPMRS